MDAPVIVALGDDFVELFPFGLLDTAITDAYVANGAVTVVGFHHPLAVPDRELINGLQTRRATAISRSRVEVAVRNKKMFLGQLEGEEGPGGARRSVPDGARIETEVEAASFILVVGVKQAALG